MYNYKDLGLSNTKEMFAKANREGYLSLIHISEPTRPY